MRRRWPEEGPSVSEDRGTRKERGRWFSRQKTEAVLRVLRGEDLDGLTRQLGVTVGPIASGGNGFWWKD